MPEGQYLSRDRNRYQAIALALPNEEVHLGRTRPLPERREDRAHHDFTSSNPKIHMVSSYCESLPGHRSGRPYTNGCIRDLQLWWVPLDSWMQSDLQHGWRVAVFSLGH